MSNHKVLIIAEAGVNHNGDYGLARELIDAAAEAGADMVKFQTFKADQLVSTLAKKASYQKRNLRGKESDSQYEMLQRLELSAKAHFELIEYCKTKKISFFSTAFDVGGLDFLNSLGFNRFKIPSGEITNYPYLKKLADFRKPIICSTGMANLGEIEEALNVLTSQGLPREQITVLHCNTEYPTPVEDVNLKAMLTIRDAFKVPIGYSDHTLGIEVPIAATALGATVIEKHFTLDRKLPGPDHLASLEPDELTTMVKAIRNVELALGGSSRKEPSRSEIKNKDIVRKSIHLKQALEADQVIEEKHLISLRPGDGISPMYWNDVIGRKAIRCLETSHQLQWKDLL